MRLVQLHKYQHLLPPKRSIAIVDEPMLRLVECNSIYEIAEGAILKGLKLHKVLAGRKLLEAIDYDSVYRGESEWKLSPAIDLGGRASKLHVSGTGLTHLGSAKNRQQMHSGASEEFTDSMKMFHWGIEGGKPAAGKIGIAPEWFYKGSGTILRAHNEPLVTPSYAEDGGEEGEIAGVYIVGPGGKPYRIGMCIGNEFSDHKFEKRNYLNLAGSKLRNCSIGPELVIDPEFKSVPGKVAIERNGTTIWSKSIATGEDEMCHSLANIEHHHFKFEAHREMMDVHVHFYGAHSLSFGDGIELLDGDIMQVAFDGFGRPLRNPVRRIAPGQQSPVRVVPLS